MCHYNYCETKEHFWPLQMMTIIHFYWPYRLYNDRNICSLGVNYAMDTFTWLYVNPSNHLSVSNCFFLQFATNCFSYILLLCNSLRKNKNMYTYIWGFSCRANFLGNKYTIVQLVWTLCDLILLAILFASTDSSLKCALLGWEICWPFYNNLTAWVW